VLRRLKKILKYSTQRLRENFIKATFTIKHKINITRGRLSEKADASWPPDKNKKKHIKATHTLLSLNPL